MLASIDIGTNTVRMLVGEVIDGRLAPVHYERCITRLGGGLCPEKGLAPDAMERTFFALRSMADLIGGRRVDRVRAVGTQALRLAVNGPDFVRRIQRELGMVVEIIAGDEEARLSSMGVRAALDPRPEVCLVFDIGGGSTEFVLAEEEKPWFSHSYPLGVVRLAESCAGRAELQAAIDTCLDRLLDDLCRAGLSERLERATLVGTAGTVTTIAAMDMGMTVYDWRRVNNYRVARTNVEMMLERLAPLSPSEREALPGMEKGRGDLIVPGLLIVAALLHRLRKHQLIVSDFGLLEGLLLDLAPAGTN